VVEQRRSALMSKVDIKRRVQAHTQNVPPKNL
jgi:hypothetical protein